MTKRFRWAWRSRALALGLGAVMALVAGEVFVRVFLPQVDAERWFETDARYGYRLKPNFHQAYHYPKAGVAVDVRTNSLGLRDREYDFSRIGTRRVLLLGDSYTFGEGVEAEDTFDARLEKLLNPEGNRYFVINSGVGGWGTLPETTYGRDHLALMRPDVIVLTFCGNDPDDDALFLSGAKDNERGRLPIPFKIFFRDHSHLYRFVFARWEIIRCRLSVARARREDPAVVVDPQIGTAITEGQWETSLERIRAFYRDFKRFNPEGLMLVQATHPLSATIREHLQQLSDGDDLRYVDLHDAGKALGRERMRLTYDGHWSPAMHEASARALYGAIRGWEARQSEPRRPAER